MRAIILTVFIFFCYQKTCAFAGVLGKYACFSVAAFSLPEMVSSGGDSTDLVSGDEKCKQVFIDSVVSIFVGVGVALIYKVSLLILGGSCSDKENNNKEREGV